MQRSWIRNVAVVAVIFLSGCAHVARHEERQRIKWQDNEWEEAVSYAKRVSGDDFWKCYEAQSKFKPNFRYDPSLQNAGEYHFDGHEIVYRDKRILYHESLHSLNHLAPRKCVSEMASRAATRERYLDRVIRSMRLSR